MAEMNPYESPPLDFQDPPPQPKPARQPQIDLALLFALLLQFLALAATAICWFSSAMAVWGRDIQRHDRNALIAAAVAAVFTAIVIVLAVRKGKQTLVFFESGILGLLVFYLLALFAF